MHPYLGMAGHAAVVKGDGSVFAHAHPEGSAAMADVMLASPMDAMEKSGPVSPVVDSPYGFPSACLPDLCPDEARRYGGDRRLLRAGQVAPARRARSRLEQSGFEPELASFVLMF
jgi:hypothetical protein